MAGNDKLDQRWDASKDTLVEAARNAGIDADIMVKISGFESGFNSQARPVSRDPDKNTITQFDGTKAISSAYGYGQFLNGTWHEMMQKYGEKYGVPNADEMTRQQANAAEYRNDPRLQAAMLAEFTRENIAKGARLGGPDADANVYAFHNLGDGDATKFLKAMKENPNQRADQVLSAAVISGNPSLYGDGSRSLAASYAAMGQKMDAYEKYAVEARTMAGQAPNPDRPAPTPAQPTPSRPGTSPMADGVLERGEKGPEVRSLQEQLIKAGITQVNGKPFVADSDFGPQTEEAVRQYQRTRGLKVDGEAGQQTFDALKNNLPDKTAPAPTPTPTPDRTDNGDRSNWPAPGNYTINKADKPGEGHGDFGTSRGGGVRTHKGVDIEGNVGDPIESFRPGTVIAVKPNNGAAGNMVTIDHGGGLTSTYMHLDTIKVKAGQEVTADTVIGTMGRSGNTPSKGDTHLHFEIRKDGAAVDPMPYLNGARSQDGNGRTELKHGDRGADVERMQNRLNELGYTDAAGKPLVADQKFGDRSKEAVEQFQRENGMQVTGVADKETLRLIDKGMTRHAAADGQLQPGEKGPDVRGLQESLNQLKMTGSNGQPLKPDGDYGDNTREAVRKFQEANNLPQTGTADRATLDRIGEQVKMEPRIDADARVNPPATTQPTTTQPETTAPRPQMSDAGHPDNRMYTQAVSNLEQLGPNGGFKSREEMERAAASLTADAKLSGLNQIDHVMRSKGGEGLIAIQGADPWAPEARRAYIDANQAAGQTLEQSTRLSESKQAETAPTANQSQRNETVDTPVREGRAMVA